MSCPSCGRENPAENAYCGACGRPLGVRAPRAYTPRHLTERILASRSALEGERKQVTVLFADVKGSTALAASVDPEEWHRVLDGFFTILTEGVHRFEGTVNQYTGDGIMALFGAPLAHEDHARRACETALHLAARLEAFRHELAEAGLEFGVRMGLHSGEVVVGKIGDDLRMDYTAQGAAVALAARIEELAEPGHILVSEETAELVRGQFDWADLGPQLLRGFPESRPVFELLGPGAGRTRLEARAVGGLSPLVGRAPELAALTGWLAESRAGQGAVVEVVGEAGMGKSRLCLELLEHCASEGIRASEAACPSHGHALPFLGIRLLLRACFGIREGDAPELMRRKVERLLSGLRSDFTAQFRALLVLLEIEEGAAPPVSAEAQRRSLAEFVRKFAQSWSATEPIVLVLDDAHWIDTESHGLVAELIDGLGWTRTLLVLSSRPQDGSPWPQLSYTRRIDLEPLDSSQTDALLTTLLGSAASLDALRARITERAAGNPYFAEEIVRSLAQRGDVLGEPGAYHPIASEVEPVLPESVRSLLAARIDQLGERDKQVLQVGSAIGHFRDRALLARVASLEGEGVEDSLGALGAAGLIREGGFAHPLTREVATLTQLTVHRQAVHAEVARAVEALHPDELGRHAELIAHHWESAGDAIQASRWNRRAALRVSNIQVRR